MKYTLIAGAVATTVTAWCYALDTNIFPKNKSVFYFAGRAGLLTVSVPPGRMVQPAISIIAPSLVGLQMCVLQIKYH